MRQISRDGRQIDMRLADDARYQSAQRARVWEMLRRDEDGIHRPFFHHPAEVHRDDIIRHLCDDARSWCEDDRGAVLALQVAQEPGTCACVVTSIAVVGSSATSRRGLLSAMAIIAPLPPRRQLPGIGIDPLLRHGNADVAEQADHDLPCVDSSIRRRRSATGDDAAGWPR
jgi:hypothetical protein